ncbi:MAG: S46 family peptidase, partial [Schleiferiaceae bacterium]|nr:S46 family peptidase [Schleiferiaceae bacterium]
MKRFYLIAAIALLGHQVSRADEGMWLPLFLSQLNEAEMQSMGMQITAEDIYSVNHSSLKDAIVHFGGFCTGEVISDKGLLLTNHHCGYRAIQSHSSVENDYLKNGFWAMNNSEELKNKGLYAEFIRYMEDATNAVMAGVTLDMNPMEADKLKKANIEALIELKKAENPSTYSFKVKSFYKGNQYFLFATEKYNDVRLVGAPPSAIGKYGADTDNWMWPRHTGDFSMFRIYASKENQPAEISDDNVPYVPVKSLSISLAGSKPGDFTMVFGFPGTTDEYLPGSAVQQTLDVINPGRIEVRETKLAILDKKMRVDDATRIKYASKYASTSNAYKKWIGQNIGLKETKALDRKKRHEIAFLYAISKDEALWDKYSDIFEEFDALYAELEPYAQARSYFFEVGYSGIEALKYAYRFNGIVGANKSGNTEAAQAAANKLKNGVEGFYKDFDADLDKQVFAALMPLYKENVATELQPNEVYSVTDWGTKANELYDGSIFTQADSKTRIEELLNKDPKEIASTLENDPIFKMMSAIYGFYGSTIQPQASKIDNEINSKMKTYMRLQMEVMKDKRFYPDANSTLRVTYGKTEGYSAKDAVVYQTHTYLDGVIAKYVPGDYEFDLPQKMIDLYEKK